MCTYKNLIFNLDKLLALIMSQDCRFPSLFIMHRIKKNPIVVGKFTAFYFPWVSACFVLSEEIKGNTPLNLSTSFSASFSSNFCVPVILYNLSKRYLLRENNEISQYPYNELCYIPLPNNIVGFFHWGMPYSVVLTNCCFLVAKLFNIVFLLFCQ